MSTVRTFLASIRISQGESDHDSHRLIVAQSDDKPLVPLTIK